MAAGSLLVTTGAALAIFAEEPAQASEGFALSSSSSPSPSSDQSFEQAFGIDAAEEPTSAPADDAGEVVATGNASYYGARFAGRPTASGEAFDPAELTAAHRTLPFGTRVKVTNQSNGRSVVVRINDRGPYHGNRLIDLSREAAERIGIVATGQGRVALAIAAS